MILIEDTQVVGGGELISDACLQGSSAECGVFLKEVEMDVYAEGCVEQLRIDQICLEPGGFVLEVLIGKANAFSLREGILECKLGIYGQEKLSGLGAVRQ